MPKAGYLNVKMDEELERKVKEAASEDDRTYLDEIRHLIRLGLQARYYANQRDLFGAMDAGKEERENREESDGKHSNAADE